MMKEDEYILKRFTKTTNKQNEKLYVLFKI